MTTLRDHYVAYEHYLDLRNEAELHRLSRLNSNRQERFVQQMLAIGLIAIMIATMSSYAALAAPTSGVVGAPMQAKGVTFSCANPHATQEISCGRENIQKTRKPKKNIQKIRKPNTIKRPAGRGYIP